MNQLKDKKMPQMNDEEEVDESNITRENNHIYFYSDIDQASIYKLNALLREAEEYCYMTAFRLNIDTIPIYLHINSGGGSILDAFAAIDYICNSRVPVHSIIEGSSASAGTLISIVCEKRYIRPTSYMLIHQLSSSLWGKMCEIEDEVQNLTELMTRIRKIYMDHSKMTKKTMDNLLKRDLWLDAHTSIKHGLVDELWTK
jgi:ATP-dependent Clp protease protease subunit